jgi:transcription elongation factor GreA
MTNPVQITQAKKDEFEKELEKRKTKLRAEISQRVQFARSLGDLSENAEYHAARDEQGKNESRIQEIEGMLKNTEIVEKSKGGTVQLMSTVLIQKEGDNAHREFTLVSSAEADMGAEKMSSESPIGAALMGKSAGDTAEVTTPGGKSIYQILKVT